MWLFRGKGRERSVRMCEGGGVIGLISPVCLSSLGSRSGSISRPGARLQLLMQLLPTLHGYLQESAVVWWSAVLVIIASLEGMNEQRGEGNFLFGFPLLLPAYKCAVKICYIVFIHAENLLLGLRFEDDCLPFFCLSFAFVALFSPLSD